MRDVALFLTRRKGWIARRRVVLKQRKKYVWTVIGKRESRGSEVVQQSVLPFGPVASVTAFLRVAQAIWKIGTKLLHLLWTSYFDDCFSVAERETSRHTDLVISAVFSILGWKLSL